MKIGYFLISGLLMGGVLRVSGQGTLTYIYDQQSAVESNPGGGGGGIQANEPIGQSFTPTLSSVGFIRLEMYDGTPNNGIGATVYVNLRSGSITGPVIGVSDPVTMPDGFGVGHNNTGFPEFIFSAPVTVTPGTTYYFQPIVQSGDPWGIALYNTFNYSGGTAIEQGVAFPANDLWFREGVVAPEPSTWALLLLGGGVWGWQRCRRRLAH